MEPQQGGSPSPDGSKSWFVRSRRGLPGDTAPSNPVLCPETSGLSRAFLFAHIAALAQARKLSAIWFDVDWRSVVDDVA